MDFPFIYSIISSKYLLSHFSSFSLSLNKIFLLFSVSLNTLFTILSYSPISNILLSAPLSTASTMFWSFNLSFTKMSINFSFTLSTFMISQYSKNLSMILCFSSDLWKRLEKKVSQLIYLRMYSLILTS